MRLHFEPFTSFLSPLQRLGHSKTKKWSILGDLTLTKEKSLFLTQNILANAKVALSSADTLENVDDPDDPENISPEIETRDLTSEISLPPDSKEDGLEYLAGWVARKLKKKNLNLPELGDFTL